MCRHRPRQERRRPLHTPGHRRWRLYARARHKLCLPTRHPANHFNWPDIDLEHARQRQLPCQHQHLHNPDIRPRALPRPRHEEGQQDRPLPQPSQPNLLNRPRQLPTSSLLVLGQHLHRPRHSAHFRRVHHSRRHRHDRPVRRPTAPRCRAELSRLPPAVGGVPGSTASDLRRY